VSPIPARRCRGASELQPQPDSMRRRISTKPSKQRDRFASVSQQAVVHRPPPDAARRRRVERVEETALGLPAHERQRCAPERQVTRCPAGWPVEQPFHQCKAHRRIVARRRDLRVSPGERVAVFAHRRLEVGTSGGMVASSRRSRASFPNTRPGQHPRYARGLRDDRRDSNDARHAVRVRCFVCYARRERRELG
jgi:hypothetical protein